MANYRAIAAASTTLQSLLRDRYPRDAFGTGLPVELYQPKDFATPMGEGIAVCLWRVAPNTTRRNLPPRTDALGRRFRPSLPIDLNYLLVPFAEQAERQQRLLGWLLRAMEDLGPLVAAQLNHALSESDVFADVESVDLLNDPLALADYLTLWDRIKALPPSATYVMRLLLLDSDVATETFPLVEERRFSMEKVPA